MTENNQAQDTDKISSGKPSRLGLYLPFGVFALLVLLWSGFWLYARGKTAEALDLWMSLERTAGRQWSCQDRAITGYPFRLSIRCDNPGFVTLLRNAGADVEVKGQLAGLSAHALLYQPNRVIAELAGPLRVVDSQGHGVTVSWQSMLVSVEGEPGALKQFSMQTQAGTLKLDEFPDTVFSAGSLETHLRRAEPAEPGSYDMAAMLRDGVLPVLDSALGSRDVVQFEMQARAEKVPRINEKNLAVTLDAWRQAGGILRLAVLKFEKGAVKLEGKGALAIDDTRHLNGQLDTSIAGAEQILARFGLGGRNAQLGGVLGALLNGGKPQPQAGALALPLRFAQGRGFLGPFNWPMPSLY